MEAGVLGDESATDGGLGMSEGQAKGLQSAPHPPTRFIAPCTQDPPVQRAAFESISNGAFNTCRRCADSSAAQAPRAHPMGHRVARRAPGVGRPPLQSIPQFAKTRNAPTGIGWALARCSSTLAPPNAVSGDVDVRKRVHVGGAKIRLMYRRLLSLLLIPAIYRWWLGRGLGRNRPSVS